MTTLTIPPEGLSNWPSPVREISGTRTGHLGSVSSCGALPLFSAQIPVTAVEKQSAQIFDVGEKPYKRGLTVTTAVLETIGRFA